MNLLFKPLELTKRFIIRERYHGSTVSYNFRSRVKWNPAGWGFNKKVIGKQHSTLHYLAYHAPTPIQKKWKKAHDIFYKKHLGTSHASVRYLNKWSCHSWL